MLEQEIKRQADEQDEMRRNLAALATLMAGKSRSEIDLLRKEKLAEVHRLQASIANRSPLVDGFAAKRDTRRVGELQREIAYLSSLLDPDLDNPPPRAA
jgi:hypothetical protein